MFDGAAYPRIGHALYERLRMVRIAGRIKTEITVQRANRGVRRTVHGHRADDGCQIDIDAGSLELRAPCGCRLPQLADIHCALLGGRRHGIEPGPLEMLDQTTLLIGGHQQLVVARSIRLQRGCGGRDPGDPRSPVADDQNRTNMPVRNEVIQR